MIPISTELDEIIRGDSQHVEPRLKAWLADMRYMENARTYSPSESVSKLIRDRSPIAYWPFNKLNVTNDVLPSITRNFYDNSGNALDLYPGNSATYPDVLLASPSNWQFNKGAEAIEQNYTRRIISTFNTVATPFSPGAFTNAGSVAAYDPDLKYYTWTTN